jgi:serine/threonine-protein kinase HipA
MTQIEEQYRRMAFNIIARNQDDHVKNIAFLMDQSGNWSLSPAFDMTYSYNPAGRWTSSHQMSLNGKRDDFTANDFTACEKAIAMKRGLGLEILEEVQAVVRQWPTFAAEAGVPEGTASQIASAHRTAVYSRA